MSCMSNTMIWKWPDVLKFSGCFGWVTWFESMDKLQQEGLSKLIHQLGLAGGEDHLRVREMRRNMTSILLVYLTGGRLQAEGTTGVFY